MCLKSWLGTTVVAGIAAVGLAGCDQRASNSLRVSAAVSLSDALDVVADEYERETGVSIVLNLAGSDTLATQLVAGAPTDVFVSADQRQMDRVQNAGLLAAGSRVDLLANQLVVVVSSEGAPALARPADLRLQRIRKVAMGDPDSVPAGVYAREYLQSVGLWKDVAAKIVPTRDVRAALAAVAAGNADAAFVYRTDVQRTDAVSVAFSVPVDPGPPIRYSAAAMSGPAQDAARRFLAFLREPVATGVFQQAGFIPLAAASSARPDPNR